MSPPDQRHRRRAALARAFGRGRRGRRARRNRRGRCAIIADPRFADLFGADSLAEAPIAATLADGRVVAGTVDRLLVTAEAVRVIDFKTGRSVPEDAPSIPPSHRAQMQAYSEALAVIFPGRRIEAALLYTAAPKLIPLDG